MASITIRNFDEQTKSRLRQRAAQRGHSMEEEARIILRRALSEAAPTQIGRRRVLGNALQSWAAWICHSSLARLCGSHLR